MAFLGYNKLEKLLNDTDVITPYNANLLEGSSYQLTLGDEAFTTQSKKGKKEILDKKNPQIEIKPGQFALLLTNEIVKIPINILAFIGIKFSFKVKGLINISGFHVDPNYKGKLIFSVYNAGARSIILEKGEPYFAIWFSEISGTKTKNSKIQDNSHKNYDIEKIPKEMILDLKGHLWNPFELTNRIEELKGIKKYNQWLFVTIISILIVLGVKIFWNWDMYRKGLNDGKMEKAAVEEIDNIICKKNIDSLISHKVDSIILLKKILND